MIRPLKYGALGEAYREAEGRLEEQIALAFGTPFPMPAEVVAADQQVLGLELAAELHAAYRADTSNAILARELRATLVALLPKDARKPDADLTGLFAALQA